jgi:outer membrane protein assembly factor BamA
MDPFEQLELFEKLRQRRENPTANLEIRLRPGYDTSKTRKFFVGNITVYSEYGPDSTGFTRRETIIDGVKIIDYRNMFKPKIIPQNVYFRRGDLYNQKKYFKTINRFNALNAWRLVNIESFPRKNEDTADFVIFLTPARKYSFTANIEATRNQNALSGNLFGIGFNIGLQNRNFAKAANQANTNLRFGVELSDSSLIQTRQFSISHNIYFPRPIPNARWIPAKWVDNFRTVLSMNAAITERLNLFNLTTFNLSWGYEFQVAGKNPNTNYNFSLRLPNIEYSTLIPRQQLLDLFDDNPALRNIFTDGLISSVILGMTRTSENKNNVNILRANMEVSGLVAGFIKGNKFLDSNLYRYIKVDLDFSRKITLNKSALVLHFFGGMGYAFESTVNKNKRNNLPFFKQYFAGGPNSMRAWGLRRLGQGSAVKAFTGTGSTPERYGDVQLEANIEYRFPLANIQGVKVFGAAFTDIGNVWFLKDTGEREDVEVFNFGRLGKDLAVGVGLGLRVDFSFFVIRFDYSYKAKDSSPSPANQSVQNKWFGYKRWRDADQFQLGISYPFVL